MKFLNIRQKVLHCQYLNVINVAEMPGWFRQKGAAPTHRQLQTARPSASAEFYIVISAIRDLRLILLL